MSQNNKAVLQTKGTLLFLCQIFKDAHGLVDLFEIGVGLRRAALVVLEEPRGLKRIHSHIAGTVEFFACSVTDIDALLGRDAEGHRGLKVYLGVGLLDTLFVGQERGVEVRIENAFADRVDLFAVAVGDQSELDVE